MRFLVAITATLFCTQASCHAGTTQSFKASRNLVKRASPNIQGNFDNTQLKQVVDAIAQACAFAKAAKKNVRYALSLSILLYLILFQAVKGNPIFNKYFPDTVAVDVRRQYVLPFSQNLGGLLLTSIFAGE